MAFFAMRTLQLALGVAVLTAAGFASAQSTGAVAPAAATAAPADAPKPAMGKRHHKHHHHAHKHGHDHRHDGNATREAEAARAEARKGTLGDGQGATQYERNAFARCQVFKTDIDRQACADRVKQGAVSGSVKDGGILRESTIEVPVTR